MTNLRARSPPGHARRARAPRAVVALCVGYAVRDSSAPVQTEPSKVLDGALYTALHRMEERGWVDSEWGTSEKKKRAKFYRLTAAGRRALRAETQSWNDYKQSRRWRV